MGVDRIGEVSDRASEGQVAGLCGTGFTAGSLARVEAKVRTRRPGIEVGSDKELMLIRRVGSDKKCGSL